MAENNYFPYAMRLCASEVRNNPCEQCPLFMQCVRNGFKPVSRLANYLAEMNSKIIPFLTAWFQGEYVTTSLRLCVSAPSNKEIMNGVYATLRVFRGEATNIICYVHLDGQETYDDLKKKLFTAYYRAKKGRLNGQAKNKSCY